MAGWITKGAAAPINMRGRSSSSPYSTVHASYATTTFNEDSFVHLYMYLHYVLASLARA